MNAATFLPCHSSGITGSGGAVVRLTSAVISSGASPAQSRNARSEVTGGVGRIEDRPGVDQRPEGVQIELELRDDAEVAAAAAQPPQQVGVLGLARVDEPAVRGDDVGRREVVAGESELPHRPADAATECEPGDAGGRHQAARRREPVRLGLVVNVGPRGAAPDGRHASGRIDANLVHR